MKVSGETVLAIVRDFVGERAGGRGEAAGLTMDSLLLQDGHVDSFSLVELIAVLEARLGLEVAPGALIPEDFESVGVLCARLEQL